MTDLLAGPAGAISLAVLAAFCFAGAAVLQHGAVSAESAADGPDGGSGDALSLRGLRAVATQRGWLTGLALAGSGSAIHAVALILAPLSVVQPVGVLAVPIAVLLTAFRARRAPDAQVIGWVAVSVVGVAGFVLTAAGTAVSNQPAAGATLLAGLVVAGVVAVLAGVGLFRSGWVRCVACATAGAVAFGLVSGLVRAVSQSITPGLAGLLDPAVAAALAAIGLAVVVGGWLVQQAFASGPPEVVIACLTVVDPIVAVLLGAVLLGEGVATPAGSWVLMGAAAVAGAAGVLGLAKHHPDAAGHHLDPGSDEPVAAGAPDGTARTDRPADREQPPGRHDDERDRDNGHRDNGHRDNGHRDSGHRTPDPGHDHGHDGEHGDDRGPDPADVRRSADRETGADPDGGPGRPRGGSAGPQPGRSPHGRSERSASFLRR